jgi:hypothetical protein
MKTLNLFLFAFPIFCVSQVTTVERPDESIEEDLYKMAYFEDKNNYSEIKSLATIVKNRNKDFANDTLQIAFYNEKGNKTQEIRYSNNSPSRVTEYNYYPNGDLLSWELFDTKYSTKTNYSYDLENRIIHTKQYRIRSGSKDSSLTSQKEFTYQDDKLMEINHDNGQIIEKYIYENDKIIMKTGGFVSKLFEYNTQNKLTKISEFMGGEIKPGNLMGLKVFQYDKQNRLICDSIQTSNNLQKNEYQITHYDYENGALKSVKVKYNSHYRNIDFEYENNKIKQITIRTNISQNTYLRHWLNSKIEDYHNFPLECKELLEYDDKGNRISKKTFVNDELFSEIQSLIQY